MKLFVTKHLSVPLSQARLIIVLAFHIEGRDSLKIMDSQRSRLESCWRIQDCYNCIHSTHGCGWCAVSSTCIPASSLLESISNPNVCPMRDERFELRTKAFGCGCSTTTLLSIIVTTFATILALMLLYGVGLAIWRINSTFGSGTWRGLEVEVKDDGSRVQRQWRRNTWIQTITSWYEHRGPHPNKSEQEQITERSRLLG